ncbi:hypothetical protein DL95DRAFT_469858 [Leptodontidium sp. 2 PMI_412]|nr:hypothetical protein DL95DRAFT_469858 [Leptodontidium sp. 2 PMI_412]
MADLIHLTDELLLQIFSNLASWADTLTFHDVNARNFNDQIRILAHTCKRLHDLLSPVLYKHLSLISQGRGPRFDHLSNVLWANRDLAPHIKTIHIGNASIKDLYFIFFLPSIHTVSVQGFLPPKNADDQKFNSFRRPGTSPVQVLHFTKCGLSELPLAWVLS